MGQAWEGSGGMGPGFAAKQHHWANQYPPTLQQQQQQQQPRRRRRQQHQQQQQQFQEQPSYPVPSGVSYVPGRSDCLLATGQPAPPQLPTPSSLVPVVSSACVSQPSLPPSGQSPHWSSAFVSSLPAFTSSHDPSFPSGNPSSFVSSHLLAPSCVASQVPSRPVSVTSSAFVRYRRPSSLRELPPCRASQAVTPALRLTIGLRSFYGGIAHAAASRSKSFLQQQQEQQQQQSVASRAAAAQFSGFVGSSSGNNFVHSSVSPHRDVIEVKAAGSSAAGDPMANGAAVTGTPWHGSYVGWSGSKHSDAAVSGYIPTAGDDSSSPYYPESAGVNQDGCYVRYSDFTLPEGQLHVGPHLPLLAGRFRFLQSLSEGGSARVFVAEDTWHPSQRTVVVKAMHRHYREVGLQEQQLLRFLNTIVDPDDSCRIVRLLAGFEFHGHTCLVLERLQGSLLEHMCRPADSPGSAAAAASAASAAASAANVAVVAVAAAGMAPGSVESAAGGVSDPVGAAAAAVSAAASAAEVAAEAAAARLEEIRSLAHDLIVSIAALHASGIIHGDLKPENILMQPLPHPPSRHRSSTSDPYVRYGASDFSRFLSTPSTSSLVSPGGTVPADAAAPGAGHGYSQYPASRALLSASVGDLNASPWTGGLTDSQVRAAATAAEGSMAAGGSSAWGNAHESRVPSGYPLPHIGSSGTSSGAGAASLAPQVTAKIADFGNSFTPEQIRTLCHDYNVQTLAYRAPEVLLGVPFSAAIDLWSLGCILAELATGQLLFACESPQHLLQQMVALLGVAPPACLFGSGKFFPKLTAAAGVPRVCCCRAEGGGGMAVCFRGCNGGGGWYGGVADGCSGYCAPMAFNIFAPGHSHLGDALAAVDAQLADLVAGLLQYDPRVRLSAQQALSHPFLKPLRCSSSSSSLSSKDFSHPLTPCTVLPTPALASPLTLYSYHPNVHAMSVPSLLLPPSFTTGSSWTLSTADAAAAATPVLATAEAAAAAAAAGAGGAGGRAGAAAAAGVPCASEEGGGVAARGVALGGGQQGSGSAAAHGLWSLQQAAAVAQAGAAAPCKALLQQPQQHQQQQQEEGEGHGQGHVSPWGSVMDGLGTEMRNGAGGEANGLYAAASAAAMADAAAAAGMGAGANENTSGGHGWWSEGLGGGPWFGAQQGSGTDADASPAAAASAAMASAAAAAAVSAASAGAAAAAAVAANAEAQALQQAMSSSAAAAAMMSCYGYGIAEIQEGAYLQGGAAYTPEGVFLPHSHIVPLTPDHLSLGTAAPSTAEQVHTYYMGFTPGRAGCGAPGNPKGLVFEPLSPMPGRGGAGGVGERESRGLVGVASTELLLAPLTPSQTREGHVVGWESVTAAGRKAGGGGARGVGAGAGAGAGVGAGECTGVGTGAGSGAEMGSGMSYGEQMYEVYEAQQMGAQQYAAGGYEGQQQQQHQHQLQQQYLQYLQQGEYQQQVEYQQQQQQQQQEEREQQHTGLMGYAHGACGINSNAGDSWMNQGATFVGEAGTARAYGEEGKWVGGRMGGACGVEYSEAPWLVAHGAMGACTPATVRLGW
ncbi:hypothetical protein CLOM_g22825 [Closterium sp. NIES-68]|nr:hypothetical protein CLOM_g22825 [Closterium sp. NIES-68]GJP82615.1 hypothetical protein CLOP_g12852 [Closterium sp. NIES-67]